MALPMSPDRMRSLLTDIPIQVSEYMKLPTWVFPRDRFVEYEAKDEVWARPLGIGRMESRPGAAMVGDVLVVHPEVMAALERETKKL